MQNDYRDLFNYIKNTTDSYDESVQIQEGLEFSHKKTLALIEFYTNDRYLTGDKDELGRIKPFYNVVNYRVTVAKTNTDLDVKDFKFEPDRLHNSVQAMLYNHEMYKWMKESNFSKTLNDMGKDRPKYGGVIVKKCEYNDDGKDELEIEIVDWRNVKVDPVTITENLIEECHYMSPSDLAEKIDVWENVEYVLEKHSKANKGKFTPIEIYEVEGEFPENLYPDNEGGSKYRYKLMTFKYAVVNDEKVLLDYNYEKKSKYKYLPWERIAGRGLGRGIVEEGFQSQRWINHAVISMKNVMDLSGKVVLATDSQKISGNAITDIDTGHIFQLEAGRSLTSVNLSASNLPQFQNNINLWNDQYDRASSSFSANTGEAPTAGTPYSQTALLNQVANTPFEYQREVWGIFLNEILNEWVLPFLKKRIMKEHYLISEYSDDELAIIDNAVAEFEAKKVLKDKLLQGIPMSAEEYVKSKEAVRTALSSLGTKREIKIPKGFLDVEGKITANITGELKNKSAILQSLDSVFAKLVSTYNPETGDFAALSNPTLREIFGNIVELAGIPISFASMKPVASATPPADLSAVVPTE